MTTHRTRHSFHLETMSRAEETDENGQSFWDVLVSCLKSKLPSHFVQAHRCLCQYSPEKK